MEWKLGKQNNPKNKRGNIMFKNKNSIWTLELFYKYIKFVKGTHLKQQMIDFTGIENLQSLILDHPYPIYKKIGGVSIETGSITIKQSSFTEILSIVSDFLFISKHTVFPSQNIKALVKWANQLDLEPPFPEACSGYILNNELVYFGEIDNTSIIQFKYKSFEITTFTLYQLSFIHTKEGLYIYLQKNG
ncbi:MAG: hypothetical protein ACRCTQ_05890 [Brevinemataceae bacterium]